MLKTDKYIVIKHKYKVYQKKNKKPISYDLISEAVLVNQNHNTQLVEITTSQLFNSSTNYSPQYIGDTSEIISLARTTIPLESLKLSVKHIMDNEANSPVTRHDLVCSLVFHHIRVVYGPSYFITRDNNEQ